MNKIHQLFILCIFLCLTLLFNSCHFTNRPLQKPKIFEYNIVCDKAALEQLCKNDFMTDHYIAIKICYNNDTVPAKLRIRGETSRYFPKKSFKIKCDSIKLSNHPKEFNLNAEYTDKSYIREYLSSKLMQVSDQPCFDAEFARVLLNGEFYGLYLRVESVDKEFLRKHGFDGKGNLYKASRDGASMSIYDDFDNKWEKKTNKKSGMDDLKMMIDSLNCVSDFEYYNFVKRTFDYDKMVNIIAMNMLLQNKSTYYHNYYMYHDPVSEKWIMFPWDMDKTLSHYNYDYKFHETSSVHWVSGNPYVERALICKPIFKDIRARIEMLSSTLINPIIINPIIDQLNTLLKNCVSLDTTDVTDVDTWLQSLNREKSYFKNQLEKLNEQFDNFPEPFGIISNDTVFIEQAYFRWHSTISPKGKAITYKLIYGTDYMLKDSMQTKIIENLTDTFMIIDGLKKELKYFWKVIATDGQYETPAFNSYNFFVFKQPTIISDHNLKDTIVLDQSHSPYVIKTDINFRDNQNVIIEKGTTIFIDSGVFVTIYGNIDIRGTLSEPVKIQPAKLLEPWKIFYIIGSKNSTIKNAYFTNGKLSCINSIVNMDNVTFDLVSGNYKFEAYVYMRGGEMNVNHCYFWGNDTSEALVLENGKASVSNSYFIHTADAIEYMGFESGEIINNYIYESNDDAIDLNGSKNIIVSGNFIKKTKGKGISVGNDKYGESKNILIERNVLIDCKQCGVGIKDNSDARLFNNTFYNMNNGIEVYRKTDYLDGGKAMVRNCIFSKITNNIVYCDKYSILDINYCLVDKGYIPGDNNIYKEPMFIDAQNLDFRLDRNSPAIDNGDPKLIKDNDGSNSDIGAYTYY